MKYHLLLVSALFCSYFLIAQKFEPVPDTLKKAYTFDFRKNFYGGELELREAEDQLLSGIDTVIGMLQVHDLPLLHWRTVLNTYDRMERAYRKLDLYYFLKYATNTEVSGTAEGDTIRSKMNAMRLPLKQKIAALAPPAFNQLVEVETDFSYFLQKLKASPLLSENDARATSHFSYLQNSDYYELAMQRIKFEPIYIAGDTIDLMLDRSAWESHPDPVVRSAGEKKFFAGYATQKQLLGYGYIHFIRGLNAFAQAKGYRDLLEEKYRTGDIPEKALENFFAAVLEGTGKDLVPEEPVQNLPALRFDILQATGIIEKALAVFGPEYGRELSHLLNPHNGRIDIIRGANRLPIRGAASVYPVYPSIFYALNYEGYLIDLTLLAHEAGHAVQATMMYNNHVRMIYGSGPAYFTESFGNFNELLTFDYLYQGMKDSEEKEIFRKQLNDRLRVIYGSTEEAFIEYHLIKGIIGGTINTPEDLDNATYSLGMRIHPEYYGRKPYSKEFWMLLDSSFREPFHNMHEMLASALSLYYYLSYLKNPDGFIPKYIKILKSGYHEPADQLLLELDMNMTDKDFAHKILGELRKQIQSTEK